MLATLPANSRNKATNAFRHFSSSYYGDRAPHAEYLSHQEYCSLMKMVLQLVLLRSELYLQMK